MVMVVVRVVVRMVVRVVVMVVMVVNTDRFGFDCSCRVCTVRAEHRPLSAQAHAQPEGRGWVRGVILVLEILLLLYTCRKLLYIHTCARITYLREIYT